MESKIFLIRNVKDKDKTKKEILDKVHALVSPIATLEKNMISVSKQGDWTKSTATLIFVEKGNDLEFTISTLHNATNKAVGLGCILAFFGLILIVVPWYLYDQEKNSFDNGLLNVANYFVAQSQ